MDVLSLRALLTLDKTQYEDGLNEAEGDAKGFGSRFTGALKTAGKAGAAAMGAAAGAVTILGKSSIQAYADTEQLVGGVQKLYGNMGMSVEDYAKSVGKSVDEVNAEWKRNEQAQKIVMDNAKNAFKTAGLSSNEYMEQATSFSAALINSLGGDTVKAAEQTDVAMRAISDNYNTFGGDMDSISYAFQGFAKQNYTMLDNLKLGYGGTKTEMQRLIDDANKWAEENGKAADLSIDSFSDVVTAIDYIQQKQNIAGTTSREAATTIAGSIGMVKSAYTNLIAGLSDPDADISKLVTDLTSSIATAGKNIMPAVSQFAEGFGKALTEMAPVIVKAIPKIAGTAIPMLVKTAAQLVSVLIKTLMATTPQMLRVGVKLLKSLADGVGNNAGSFIKSGMDLLLKFSEFLRSSADTLIPIALTLVQKLAQGIIDNIPTFIATVPEIISNFANIINDNAPKILETGISILKSLVTGIIKAIPVLIANIPKIISAFVAVIKAFGWMNVGRTIIKGLAAGIRAAGALIKGAITKPITATKAAVVAGFAAAKDKAVEKVKQLKDAVKTVLTSAKDKVKSIVGKIKSAITGGFQAAKDKVKSIVGKIKDAVSSGFKGAKDKAAKWMQKLKDKVSEKITAAKDKIKKVIEKIKGYFPFNVGKVFKGWVPKIKLFASKKSDDKAETSSSVSKENFAKAMSQPYMFKHPTEFYAGDAGDEMLYGRTALLGDIRQAVKKEQTSGGDVIINMTYNAGDDASDMVRSIAREVRRYRMAGAF